MLPMMQILSAIQQVRQNPAMLNDLLLQKGRITPQQYQQMQQQGISGNPEAIGNYMMGQGMFSPQQAQQEYQQAVGPIQQSLKQN